jgi:tRNA threonylcarbamoyladenosine biosynthesis protein TsaE
MVASATFTTHSVEETREVGARTARSAAAGDVYALEGDLGTGKTEFVRGFVNALGGAAAVRSPSFTILNIYDAPAFQVFHFDFYRLSDASELNEIGFQEYTGGEGVCLIEWGTMFREVLPPHTKIIRFIDEGGSDRKIECGES